MSLLPDSRSSGERNIGSALGLPGSTLYGLTTGVANGLPQTKALGADIYSGSTVPPPTIYGSGAPGQPVKNTGQSTQRRRPPVATWTPAAPGTAVPTKGASVPPPASHGLGAPGREYSHPVHGVPAPAPGQPANTHVYRAPAPVTPGEQLPITTGFAPATTTDGLVTVWPGDTEPGMQVPFSLGPATFADQSSDEDNGSTSTVDQPNVSISRRGKDLLAALQPFCSEIKQRSSTTPACHDASEFLGSTSSSAELALHHSQLLLDKLAEAERRLKGLSHTEDDTREVSRDSRLGSVSFPKVSVPIAMATPFLPIDNHSSMSEYEFNELDVKRPRKISCPSNVYRRMETAVSASIAQCSSLASIFRGLIQLLGASSTNQPEGFQFFDDCDPSKVGQALWCMNSTLNNIMEQLTSLRVQTTASYRDSVLEAQHKLSSAHKDRLRSLPLVRGALFPPKELTAVVEASRAKRKDTATERLLEAHAKRPRYDSRQSSSRAFNPYQAGWKTQPSQVASSTRGQPRGRGGRSFRARPGQARSTPSAASKPTSAPRGRKSSF